MYDMTFGASIDELNTENNTTSGLMQQKAQERRAVVVPTGEF